MTTASPLKSASSVMSPDVFGDNDTDYAEKYQNAKDAEDKLMQLLDKRQESRLSPSMLSLAGALLDPGRTGSFGEALGRGATAYANMQPQEDKQLQENAMMQMQLRNMQLERAQQGKISKMAAPFIQGFLNPDGAAKAPNAAPVNSTNMSPEVLAKIKELYAQNGPEVSLNEAGANAPAPAPAEPVEQLSAGSSNASDTFKTGLATPAAVTAKTPISDVTTGDLPPAAPLAATAVIDTSPDIMINGRKVNPEIIAGLKMVPATRAIGEALDGVYKQKIAEREYLLKTEENRRQNEAAVIKQAEEKRNQRAAQIKEVQETRDVSKNVREQGEFERGAYKTTPWGYMDLTDPKKPKPVYIANPGEADVGINFPEYDGDSLLGSREDLMKLREARSNKDKAGVDAIYNYLKFGVSGKPVAGDKNQGQPSADDKAVTKAAREKTATVSAEAQSKQTQDFLNNESSNRDTVYTAARIMKNASGNSKMYGLLKQPGLGTALASFIRDKGEVGDFAITKDNLENFLRLKKFDTTKEDMTAVAEMASDLARLHFQFRKNLLANQGSVSDREDAGIAKIQGTPADTPEYLIKMAQLTGRKAQFDTQVAADFKAYRRQIKDPYAVLDVYKSDPKSGYQKVLNSYDDWLTKTYNLPQNVIPKAKPETASKGNSGALNDSTLDAILKKRNIK